jgi:hypothetical protein
MNQAIFFYSLKCSHCLKCIELIETHNSLFTYISYVQIDTLLPQDIPQCITRVPTLVFNNGETVLVGKKVYSYLIGEIAKSEGKTASNKISNGTGPNTMNTSNNGIDGFLPSIDEDVGLNTGFILLSDHSYTIADNINYDNIRSLDTTTSTKISINPDKIQSLRDSELKNL